MGGGGGCAFLLSAVVDGAEAVSDEGEERRLRIDALRERHTLSLADPADPCCNWCGEDWPCGVAFLLAEMDEMKSKHVTEMARAFLAGARGEDE